MFFTTILVAMLTVGAFVRAEPSTYNGLAILYYPGGGSPGACGAPSLNTDYVASLSPTQYAGGANCYRHIGIHYQGKFVDATVVDECVDCTYSSIALSPAAFGALAPIEEGFIYDVSWDYE